MWGERNYGAEALPECHSNDLQRGITVKPRYNGLFFAAHHFVIHKNLLYTITPN